MRSADARGQSPDARGAPADAVAAIAKTKPSAVVLAGCPEGYRCGRSPPGSRSSTARWFRCWPSCRTTTRPRLQMLYQFPPTTVPTRLVPRLRAALRVRALHATVLRRAEELAERSDAPDMPETRSDRGRDRAGRRARTRLSGADRRGRRAHGPDRRALDRDRAQLSRRARHRRRGDRRRLQPLGRRGFHGGARRRSALARPAGDRAARQRCAISIPSACRMSTR